MRMARVVLFACVKTKVMIYRCMDHIRYFSNLNINLIS
jgi:hypothetical protein